MEKLVVIINGAGGVGKDTICAIVAKHYRANVISAIDPIKSLAVHGGWAYEDKSLKGRRLLSQLKAAFVEYNNLPLQHLMREYSKFLESSSEILFAHIREPDEISKFRAGVTAAKCATLLVTSPTSEHTRFGNSSDDDVKNYDYDYVYSNALPLSALEEDFMAFFRKIVQG